jgi:hypothetical protein
MNEQQRLIAQRKQEIAARLMQNQNQNQRASNNAPRGNNAQQAQQNELARQRQARLDEIARQNRLAEQEEQDAFAIKTSTGENDNAEFLKSVIIGQAIAEPRGCGYYGKRFR